MKRSQRWIQWLLIAAIILIVNVLGQFFFVRGDLTEEGRYSVSPQTRSLLRQLDNPLTITIYAEGKFPANVQRFQESLRTLLFSMRRYSRGNLEFEFVDPTSSAELRAELQRRGFGAIQIQVQESATEKRQQAFWPVASLRYNDRETWIDLVKGAAFMTVSGPSVDFAQAEADLEYKLVVPIRNLVGEQQGAIGLLRGHGELGNREINELGAELANRYALVDYNQRTTYAGQAISPDIRVMLILDPKEPFSERDKYELDQYLIRGGRILLLLNYQEVDLDVYNKQATLTRLRELNLDDFLMQYGLRLNYDLIQDRECEKTELFQPGPGGGTFVPRPWPFYPLLLNLPEHPFTRNADAVLLRYASSIDTLPRPGSRRSVFLQTSARSRTLPGSQYIEVNQVVGQPIPDALFNRPGLIAGALSEGSFLSLFNGREAPTDSSAPQPPTATFGPQNHPDYLGAIALISDASFAQGKRFRDQTGYIPYDNKTVISNAVDYLAGDDVLLGIRAKKVQVRPLDKQKSRDYALALRLVNLLGPVLLLLLFGLVRHVWRRRRFGQAQA